MVVLPLLVRPPNYVFDAPRGVIRLNSRTCKIHPLPANKGGQTDQAVVVGDAGRRSRHNLPDGCQGPGSRLADDEEKIPHEPSAVIWRCKDASTNGLGGNGGEPAQGNEEAAKRTAEAMPRE